MGSKTLDMTGHVIRASETDRASTRQHNDFILSQFSFSLNNERRTFVRNRMRADETGHDDGHVVNIIGRRTPGSP